MSTPIEQLMNEAMKNIKGMVDANTIIGDKIVVDDVTIIPVSKLSFGFASGASDFVGKNNKQNDFLTLKILHALILVCLRNSQRDTAIAKAQLGNNLHITTTLGDFIQANNTQRGCSILDHLWNIVITQIQQLYGKIRCFR